MEVTNLMIADFKKTFTPMMMKDIEVPRIFEVFLSSKYALQKSYLTDSAGFWPLAIALALASLFDLAAS